jgi:hypothetical protein
MKLMMLKAMVCLAISYGFYIAGLAEPVQSLTILICFGAAVWQVRNALLALHAHQTAREQLRVMGNKTMPGPTPGSQMINIKGFDVDEQLYFYAANIMAMSQRTGPTLIELKARLLSRMTKHGMESEYDRYRHMMAVLSVVGFPVEELLLFEEWGFQHIMDLNSLNPFHT